MQTVIAEKKKLIGASDSEVEEIPQKAVKCEREE